MTFWIGVGKEVVYGVTCIVLVGLFICIVGLAVHFLDKLDGREKE